MNNVHRMPPLKRGCPLKIPSIPSFHVGASLGAKTLAHHTDQYQSSRISPQFSGATHSVQNRRWLLPETFQKLLNASSTPFVGKLPSVFINLTKEDPKQVYQAFDELRDLLKGLKPIEHFSLLRGFDDFALEFNIGHSKQPLSLKYIGDGGFGTVYQLTINNQPFALKVYNNNEEPLHGAYEEVVSGLYFSKVTYKDVARFYFGNPIKKWEVIEFITPTMSVESRSGKSIYNEPVIVGDDREENYINGIRYDYGGFCQVGRTITYPEEVVAVKQPAVHSKEAFLLAMDSHDPAIQANAASQIYWLPKEFRKEAFLVAMKTQQPIVQANAASNIPWLPIDFQKKAFLWAMKTNNLMVQVNAASKIHAFSSGLRKKAFLWAMKTQKPEIQAQAVQNILFFPEKFRQKAFLLAMETNHPDVQASAVLQALALPSGFIEEALKMYVQAFTKHRTFHFIQNLKVVPLSPSSESTRNEFRKTPSNAPKKAS